MKYVYKKKLIITSVLVLFFAVNINAQDITYFFKAGDMSGEPDRFGNVYTVGPSDAILETPIGDPELEGVFFEEDNLWAIYPYIGDIFLISHAPGFWEDAPELTSEITVAMGGKYEVIFNFIDSNSEPGTGPIQAALGDEDLVVYSADNSVRRSGGTSPAYPVAGGSAGSGFWYSVSLGEVEVEAGETIQVRVDDVPGDQFDIFASLEVGSTFHGITLRVIELDAALKEIQVSPGAFEWTTDVSGNQFRTWPVDEAAYPTADDWRTVTTREDGSGLWNIRDGLGPYGPILESFPENGNDAMPLQTSVIFAEGGTYDVYLNVGDTGDADPEDNIENPNPLNFAFEGEDLQTYVAGDGEFKGTPGYNDYEIHIGSVSVEDGEQLNFIIDDVQDFEGVQRSVYMGMKFIKQEYLDLDEITVSPGVFEEFTDLGGNTYSTWPQDEAAFPTQEDWLTITTREDGSGKWNIRENLGTYGPILESFPENGNDAMPLRTSVQIRLGGTYEVYLRVGDIGDADPDENLENPTPLKFGIEGEDLNTYGAWDGTFEGTPGYNDYEVLHGEITVEDGETVNFIIDDATDYEGAQRSVYLGIRLVKMETNVHDWSIY